MPEWINSRLSKFVEMKYEMNEAVFFLKLRSLFLAISSRHFERNLQNLSSLLSAGQHNMLERHRGIYPVRLRRHVFGYQQPIQQKGSLQSVKSKPMIPSTLKCTVFTLVPMSKHCHVPQTGQEHWNKHNILQVLSCFDLQRHHTLAFRWMNQLIYLLSCRLKTLLLFHLNFCVLFSHGGVSGFV